MDERIEAAAKAAMNALGAQAETWMPKEQFEKLAPVVKWEEDGQQRESVCYNQAGAELFATRLLQQADVEEVFLVLRIKKVQEKKG